MAKKYIILVSIIMLYCTTISVAASTKTTIKSANTLATPEAQAVLSYLTELPSRKTKKLISGQFESWGDAVKPLNNKENWVNKTYQATGNWVGLMGIEYHTDDVYPDKPNQAAIEFWQNGGLIQLYLIMSNPAAPKTPNGGGKCDIDLILKKGHPYNKYFFAELDKVADGLKVLEQEGVVVFVNMYAEMTADWFWWGEQEPEKFKQLYRTTFEYLVKEKGLNNLLFVFEPSAQQRTAIDYYPGNAFVDMVGISIFVDHNEALTGQKLPMYKQLLQLGKPMSFSQWGPRRGKDQTGNTDQVSADNLKLLRGIKTYFPEICWWMNWSQAYAISAEQNSNLNAQQLLDDPWVVNRNDINWKKYLKH